MISFTPGRFIPEKRARGSNWTGGCVGPRARMDCGGERYRAYIWKRTRDCLARSLVALPTELS
jgi:hypothetical protein